MDDTISITPTLIRRKGGDKIELATVPADDGGRALLVFMDEQQAERFRQQTGAFPASEGFTVGATHLEGLKAILWAWKLERVALRGPEADAVSVFGAKQFLRDTGVRGAGGRPGRAREGLAEKVRAGRGILLSRVSRPAIMANSPRHGMVWRGKARVVSIGRLSPP